MPESHQLSLRASGREPVAIDLRSSKAGLVAVALFEAVKGVIVLLLATAFLSVHREAEELAWNLIFHLHIDPDRRLAQSFLEAAGKLSQTHWVTIVSAALAYSTVRFVEAWGLWHRRVWAEWFALLSGCMYLPWEILKMAEKPSWLHLVILAANVCIVVYMLVLRLGSLRRAELR